jgi:putative phosphoesterase
LFEEADEIWHAGDIGSLAVADSLSALKPLRAVYGNIDDSGVRVVYPECQIFYAGKIKVMLVHIAGTPGHYSAGIKNRLEAEKPAILVCGHSHIARVEFDRKMNLLFINPGAAGKHGFHNIITALRFSITGDRIHDMEVIELGERGKVF